MMRWAVRLLVAAALALGGVAPRANAQTQSGLPVDVTAFLPTNGLGLITAANLRALLLRYSSVLSGWGNTYAQKTIGYAPATTDCGSTLGLAGGASYTVTFGAPAGFLSSCVVMIVNEDTVRAKELSLNGFAGAACTAGGTNCVKVYPQQALIVFKENGTWKRFPPEQRWGLPAGGAQFFIDNVLGNDASDGLAAGTGAFASWNGFISALFNFVDTQQRTVNVQLAAGQSWSNFVLTGNVVGGGTIMLDLNGNTLTGTGGVNGNALTVNSAPNAGNLANAIIFVRNGTITCSGGAGGIVVVGGLAGIYDLMTMGSCPGGAHFIADSPLSRLTSPFDYTISGGAAYHEQASNGGHLDFDQVSTVTLTGTPNFTQAFAYALVNGMIVSRKTYVGSGATGIRYQSDLNGTINSGNVGPNHFPGNVAGFVGRGGGYDTPGTPGISSCGTSPGSAIGTDTSGHVLEGTTATGCVITFTSNNQPLSCIPTTNSATANAGLYSAVSATQLAVVHPSVSGVTLYWICPPVGN